MTPIKPFKVKEPVGKVTHGHFVNELTAYGAGHCHRCGLGTRDTRMKTFKNRHYCYDKCYPIVYKAVNGDNPQPTARMKVKYEMPAWAVDIEQLLTTTNITGA